MKNTNTCDGADKIYMNTDTGSVGTREEWWYEGKGKWANGVDDGTVAEVISDGDGWWVEVA